MWFWILNWITQTKSHVYSLTKCREISPSLLLKAKLSHFTFEFLRETKRFWSHITYISVNFKRFILLLKGSLVSRHRTTTSKIAGTGKYIHSVEESILLRDTLDSDGISQLWWFRCVSFGNFYNTSIPSFPSMLKKNGVMLCDKIVMIFNWQIWTLKRLFLQYPYSRKRHHYSPHWSEQKFLAWSMNPFFRIPYLNNHQLH